MAITYMVVLDKFHISKTRSVHEDTDYVTLTVQVNQQPPVNQTIFVGNVNDGDHPVNLQLGPFDVGPNDTLALNYVVLNKGHGNGDRTQIEDGLAKAATAAIVAEFPSTAGYASFILKALGEIIGVIDADCDGNCAAQQFKFSGAELEQNSSSTGSFGKTTPDEFESQDGCGASGQYDVTWHIQRVAPVGFTGIGVVRDHRDHPFTAQ